MEPRHAGGDQGQVPVKGDRGHPEFVQHAGDHRGISGIGDVDDAEAFEIVGDERHPVPDDQVAGGARRRCISDDEEMFAVVDALAPNRTRQASAQDGDQEDGDRAGSQDRIRVSHASVPSLQASAAAARQRISITFRTSTPASVSRRRK